MEQLLLKVFETNEFEEERQRQSNLYIFGFLHHRDKKIIDPLNLYLHKVL